MVTMWQITSGISVPRQPSGSGGINNMLAVDAEHEHSSVLSEKKNRLYLFVFKAKQTQFYN